MRLLSLCTFITILSTISFTCRADDIQKQFLDTHNVARSQSRGPSPNLEGHLGFGSPYGENYKYGYGAFGPEQTVNTWISERSDYNHDSNTCKAKSDCSHYTQVVWRNSVYVGCAITYCGAGWPYVACEYYPPGNIPGQSPY
ncbi:hypothetical protein RND81_09G093100 [Saponaria officinalis]|uniref:SCP domain-containing protein n=1 Tax=Saponaria officinalis TaxID=3572 RepID=A0AAW1IKU0_SAPOF